LRARPSPSQIRLAPPRSRLGSCSIHHHHERSSDSESQILSPPWAFKSARHHQGRTLPIIVGGTKSHYIAVEGANLKVFVFYMVNTKWYCVNFSWVGGGGGGAIAQEGPPVTTTTSPGWLREAAPRERPRRPRAASRTRCRLCGDQRRGRAWGVGARPGGVTLSPPDAQPHPCPASTGTLLRGWRLGLGKQFREWTTPQDIARMSVLRERVSFLSSHATLIAGWRKTIRKIFFLKGGKQWERVPLWFIKD
jgi:hypothetical protein